MKERIITCIVCNKKIKGRFPKNKKFCSKKCSYKYWDIKHPDRMRKWRAKNYERSKITDRKYYEKNKEKKLQSTLKWQKLNPEKHRKTRNKAFMKYYYKNKERLRSQMRENAWVYKRRNQILNLIGKNCGCEKKATHIHHLKYTDLPREDIKKYSKFLIPLCRDCHYKLHKKK